MIHAGQIDAGSKPGSAYWERAVPKTLVKRTDAYQKRWLHLPLNRVNRGALCGGSLGRAQ